MKKVIIIMCTITCLFCLFIVCLVAIRKSKPTSNILISTIPQTTKTHSNNDDKPTGDPHTSTTPQSTELHINSEGKLNINTATAEELMVLNGIGEVLAQRIVEFREEHGPFKETSDLLDVKGIGPAKLENIIEQICTE